MSSLNLIKACSVLSPLISHALLPSLGGEYAPSGPERTNECVKHTEMQLVTYRRDPKSLAEISQPPDEHRCTNKNKLFIIVLSIEFGRSFLWCIIVAITE